jgi:hypothetical protein
MTPISADTVFRFFSVREFTIYFSLEVVDLTRWSASKHLSNFCYLCDMHTAQPCCGFAYVMADGPVQRTVEV